MNKKTYIFLLSIILIPTFIGCLRYFESYFYEIPYRMAKYHNTGHITVVSDGKTLDLTGEELHFINLPKEHLETVTLEDGSFAFKTGEYGKNCFSLRLPHETLGEVIIRFGVFNTNWWHVNEYEVEVELTTMADGSVLAHMKKSLDESYNNIYEEKKILTKADNTISHIHGP